MKTPGARTRRRPFARLAAVLALSLVAGCAGGKPPAGGAAAPAGGTPAASQAAANQPPIKIGLLEDHSGNLALVGLPKYHAAQLAVKEINDRGGLLGRKVDLIAPDAQSDMTRYQEMARKLILDDKVDVVIGAQTSASREAIRPIMDQYKMLYIYTNQYEGGVCDNNVFATGAVPEHQVETVIPWMIQKFGPKIYTIAADYNFGHLTSKWVRNVAAAHGGQVIGEEFIPLDVSQFSSTIDRIQKARPDFLVTLLVGIKQSSFYEQKQAAGMQLPMATTVNMAQAYEHKRFKPPALANMYIATNYMEELETETSKAFVKKWKAMFPDEPYIGEESESEYTAIHLWAKAVEKAGTADKAAVRKALESGISFDAPSGTVSIDPKTHHAIRTISLAHADANHKITFPMQWDNVTPSWLAKAKGCDLTTKEDATQYEP